MLTLKDLHEKKGGKIDFLVHTKVSAFRCFCDEK
jgi:hypothetical protein